MQKLARQRPSSASSWLQARAIQCKIHHFVSNKVAMFSVKSSYLALKRTSADTATAPCAASPVAIDPVGKALFYYKINKFQ